MPNEQLDLLVIGDMHHVGPATPARTETTLKLRLGLEMAVRAVRDALRLGRPDAIVLLGDIVDRGSAVGAVDDLRLVRDTLARFEIPLVAVPGNHDDDPEVVQQIFGCPTGVHELNGYLLVTFADRYAANTEAPSRPVEQMAALQQVAGSGRPIIAVQHAVIRPAIRRDYPYNFTDADAVAAAYAKAGVCLSISGHFHAGLPPHVENGVTYLVCPVMADGSFAYTRLRMNGRELIAAERVPLSLADTPGLHDFHVHTDFAYCATDITPAGALERMALLGIPTTGLTEHADHLYMPREGFWKRTDTNELAALRRARLGGHDRYDEFRRRLLPLRSQSVRLGLEAEAAADGSGLAILDNDAEHCDYLIGAVHHFGQRERESLSQGELDRLFMAATRQLVDSGVHILAHPFRYFPKKRGLASPERLYRPVVDLLAERGVAAEINFHTYTPDPAFYALCVQLGVKLALGSDAHSLVEVAELRPHLDLLRQIGAIGRLNEVLYNPA